MRRVLSPLLAPLLALTALAVPAHAKDTINFGDDTSSFANNGECDDPRFEGDGMAAILTNSDRGHDATDCASGVKAGKIRFQPLPAYAGEGDAPTIGEIDFGDDESTFANDGNCDDRRFGGRTMAEILIDSDIRHDAADCRAGMEAGDLAFVQDLEATVANSSDSHLGGGAVDLSGIDFGDNTGAFALNGECDDRRFEGEGVDETLLESDVGHDASDCALAVIDGRATYKGPSGRIPMIGDIDFGDDTSAFAGNGECDDPRFKGEFMATILLDEDIGHDATDCNALLAGGSIEYVGEGD